MKKQTVISLVLLLMIPVVLMLGGLVFSLINPEIAAGHPNYVVNYHLLNTLKISSFFGMFAVAAALWVLSCFFLIQSKQRSPWWLLCAAFGPFGFAALAMLRHQAPSDKNRHERFLQKQNKFVRIGYHVCLFVIIWMLADQAIILKRNLMIRYESARTGVPVAQIIDQQNASSGMWAFGEGLESMFIVVLLYLIWPIAFDLAGSWRQKPPVLVLEKP